jgi:lipid A 3-O-deacylase
MHTRVAAARLATLIGLCGAVSLGCDRAWSAPVDDPSNTVTVQAENATVALAGLTDKYYVNGLGLSWTSPTGAVGGTLSSLDRAVWGDGQQREILSLVQQIYTPANTHRIRPNPNDRPYAGLLLGNFGLLSDTDTSRSVIQLSLGLVGPDSGGEALQDAFHDVINQPHASGWAHQIQDTAAVEVMAERTWRAPLTHFDNGLEVDALPALTGAVGDLRDYAQAGVTLRLGQGLNSDFGAPRLRPGLSGEDAFVATRPLAWYVFAGADAQVVGYDLLLQASPFRSGPQAPLERGVVEGQFGFSALTRRFRLSLGYVLQSAEVRGQIGGTHQFITGAIAAKF